MAFLLDTCSISEFVVKSPNRKVIDYLTHLPREEIYLSAVTVGELEHGVEIMTAGARRDFLMKWHRDHVLVEYAERTIAVDTEVGREWGRLRARLREGGWTMQVVDSLIAATALVHGLTVVTRNEKDFAHCGVGIANPWK